MIGKKRLAIVAAGVVVAAGAATGTAIDLVGTENWTLFRNELTAHDLTGIQAAATEAYCPQYNDKVPGDSTPTTSEPPPTTTTPPPAVANFVVTDSTSCSAVDDWLGTSGTRGPLDPKDAAIYDGQSQLNALDPNPLETYVVSKGYQAISASSLETTCTGDPTLTVSAALKQGTP